MYPVSHFEKQKKPVAVLQAQSFYLRVVIPQVKLLR